MKSKKEKQFKCKHCEEYLNGWKRAQADYENLKKSTAQEKESFAKFANLNLILEFITIYNNFKLSFEHLPENLKDNDWVKGIQHTENQFKKVLEQNGVEEILPSVDEEFNANEMEAIEDNKKEIKKYGNKEIENKIEKVVSRGYKLKDKVIIPAKVVVK